MNLMHSGGLHFWHVSLVLEGITVSQIFCLLSRMQTFTKCIICAVNDIFISLIKPISTVVCVYILEQGKEQ